MDLFWSRERVLVETYNRRVRNAVLEAKAVNRDVSRSRKTDSGHAQLLVPVLFSGTDVTPKTSDLVDGMMKSADSEDVLNLV